MLKENSNGDCGVPATQVWFVDVAACSGALQAWHETARALDSATAARLALIKRDDERQTRFAVHCALRALIEHIKGPHWRGKPLMYSDMGQPTLPGLGLSLSLSHTVGAGLIALSPASTVGVDIERRDRDIKMQPDRQQAIISAARALSSQQADHQPVQVSFLSAWVQLESYGKATGLGLAPLLTDAMAPLRKTGRHAKVRDTEGASVPRAIYDLDVPVAFVAAVALGSAEPAPKVHRFPETVSDLSALLAVSGR